MLQIMTLIRHIDRDRNGYVTVTEIDDILKEVYAVRLEKADLKPIIKPFCSLQNPILVDYRGLRDYIQRKVERFKLLKVLESAPNNQELSKSNVITVSDLVKKRKQSSCASSQIASLHNFGTVPNENTQKPQITTKPTDKEKAAKLIETMAKNSASSDHIIELETLKHDLEQKNTRNTFG